MTLFLSFRSAPRAGAVLSEPQVLEGNGVTPKPRLKSLKALPAALVAGREVVFVTHGFNVDYERGVRSLARLEQALKLPPAFLFVGVLWPGDWWVPVINYPAEADDAVRTGRNLAKYSNARLTNAATISLVSHSLGARVVLEAVKELRRKAREVCVMAAAADDDCLTNAQYDAARRNAERVSVLASRRDRVLQLAYPVGDFLSDLFAGDDDRPLRRALGFHGPRPLPKQGTVHAQIPDRIDYGHFDYLPPDDLDDQIVKQQQPIRFVSEVLTGLAHAWPPLS
jgi:esterase/lipase superfamily enzyme